MWRYDSMTTQNAHESHWSGSEAQNIHYSCSSNTPSESVDQSLAFVWGLGGRWRRSVSIGSPSKPKTLNNSDILNKIFKVYVADS